MAPLSSGRIHISMTAVTVDEEEPQLLDQEIVRHHIETIDDLLSLIREHVCIAPAPAEGVPAQSS
jgi:hypothetical protein